MQKNNSFSNDKVKSILFKLLYGFMENRNLYNSLFSKFKVNLLIIINNTNMPILTTQELESFKIQMEATINNPSSLFIASELNVVLSNLLKDKNFFVNPK